MMFSNYRSFRVLELCLAVEGRGGKKKKKDPELLRREPTAKLHIRGTEISIYLFIYQWQGSL